MNVTIDNLKEKIEMVACDELRHGELVVGGEAASAGRDKPVSSPQARNILQANTVVETADTQIYPQKNLTRSCLTTQNVGKPNQTTGKTTEKQEIKINSQYKSECGEARKKSLVREAILKFSEKPEKTPKIPKLETVTKTRAPKSETGGVAPKEDLNQGLNQSLNQIVRNTETKPEVTKPKPNQNNPPPPTPKIIVKIAREVKTKPTEPEEKDQVRGLGIVIEGGKPRQQPKPNPVTPNQTRKGKPNQRGKKHLKEEGQPTLSELL